MVLSLSGVARKKLQGRRALPLQEFLRWMKIFYAIRDVQQFVRIKTNDNFSNSRESKKILLFPTESHAKMLAFEKLHKLTNNCKWFFAGFKLNFYFLL